MSNINNSKKDNPSSTTEKNSNDFVTQLQQNIDDTDWFLNNISIKWQQENPQLAKQWQEILKNNNEINDSTKNKT